VNALSVHGPILVLYHYAYFKGRFQNQTQYMSQIRRTEQLEDAVNYLSKKSMKSLPRRLSEKMKNARQKLLDGGNMQ
jgi:hypothetical protein